MDIDHCFLGAISQGGHSDVVGSPGTWMVGLSWGVSHATGSVQVTQNYPVFQQVLLPNQTETRIKSSQITVQFGVGNS